MSPRKRIEKRGRSILGMVTAHFGMQIVNLQRMQLSCPLVLGCKDAEDDDFKCPYGLHPCSNANFCIPQAMNCDGLQDCPNGSDEKDCDDEVGSLYYDHLFPKRPMGDTEEETVQCDFDDAGSNCLCGAKKALCDNLELTEVPDSIASAEFTDISMTGNYIPVLENRTLKLMPSAELLLLSHCRVKIIKSEAFATMTNLMFLYLDNNEITELPDALFPEDNKITELSLKHNLLDRIPAAVLETLTSLQTLFLDNNRITTLQRESFPHLPELVTLGLTNNHVARMDPGVFDPVSGLMFLYLSHNRITSIADNTFRNLTNLQGLNLNVNLIRTVQVGAFSGLEKLHSLNLQKNRLVNIQPELFTDLAVLEYLYLDQFQQCAIVPHVRVCEPRGDGISSQDHLLDSPILRVSVWIVAVLACVVNMVVFVGRILMKEPNAVHSLFITNLSISDFFMGLYLFIIAIADHKFRGIYLSWEYAWRRSTTCTFAGVLNTLSSLSSIMILVLITWDRLICVVKPLAPRHSLRSGVYITCGLWFVALFMSLLPLTGIFGDAFYGSNGVCVPLQFHDAFAEGWIYSALLFAVFNSAALIFIVGAYWFMFFVIRSSGLSVRSTQERREGAVARRFALIVLTDCACWVPIIITKLMVLGGQPFTQDLYGWLAVFIMPVNAALNPVFYTLTTNSFKEKIGELICSLSCGRLRMREDDVNMNANPAPRFQRRNMRRTGTGSTTLQSCSSWRSSQGTTRQEGTAL